MHSKYILIGLSVVAALAAVAVVVSAGDPDNPPGLPETTYSYRLEDIYDRLATGAAGTQITFTEPTSGPTVGTGHTLDEIMAVAPQVDGTNGATAAQVLSGKTYWSLRSGAWGLQTGTMPNNGAVTIVPTTMQQTIAAGYHNGSGYVAGDADLVSGNIKGGVSVFGVGGTLYAPVPRTGQTTSYASGDDGHLEMGAAWPSPRFITSTTGTTGVTVVVTDTLTGLVWLQDANCIANQYPGFDNDGTSGDGRVTWQHALDFVAGMTATGSYSNCAAGFSDWRLPNLRELQSLVDYGEHSPALPDGHPFTFTAVTEYVYWSSSTSAAVTSSAWYMRLIRGYVEHIAKTSAQWVWPVRGGQ